MGGKLTDKDMDQLEQWIGTGSKTFTLLYAITRDGCNTTTFHQKCDNQGPTVTVLYNQQGSVYGGFAPVSWTSSGAWVNNTTAFLYQLRFSGNDKATKFTLKSTGYQQALYHNQNYGPLFGAGNDLCTFTNTVNSSGTSFTLNGDINIGSSYDNQGVTAAQINNGNMNVTELEVYKLADGKRNPTNKETKPWRKTKVWNEKFLDELTEDIVAFKPLEDLKVKDARILMIGPVGAGKSSFYNTVNSIFRGRLTQRAGSGSAEQSLTTAFNPAKPINPKTQGFKANPTPSDMITCAVFVLDASTLEALTPKLIEKMKSFQTLMNQKGVPQIVLLTKIDKLCKEVQADVSSTYKNATVEKHVDKASQLLGLPRANVLPVKNYENELELDDHVNILALLSLRQILYLAEDFMENMLEKRNDEESEMENLKLEN